MQKIRQVEMFGDVNFLENYAKIRNKQVKQLKQTEELSAHNTFISIQFTYCTEMCQIQRYSRSFATPSTFLHQ